MTPDYPPPPWHLQGTAFQVFQPIPLTQARRVIPAELEVITVFPGHTIGGVYLSKYEPGSILTYNELIVSAGFVRFKGEIGAWISHIYVDSPHSVAGGRNIWGLPKELAAFDWQPGCLTVTQGERELCQLHYSSGGIPLSFWGKTRIQGSVFSGLRTDILKFTSHFEANLRNIRGRIHTPDASPFAPLLSKRAWLTLQMQNLNLNVPAPDVVGQWHLPRSLTAL
jgi:hypothetical protein